MLRRIAWLVVLGALFASGVRAWVAPEPAALVPPEPTYEEAIDVSLLTMVVRVIDTWGNPILGLEAEDFRVRLGKAEVPVAALDWVASSGELPAIGAERGVGQEGVRGGAAPSPSAEGEPASPSDAGGRLVVVFVQADLTPSRISGQMRLRPYTGDLLAGFQARDRVAVVSFDSHLKLWQDFASDVGATRAAIDEAMLFSPERDVAVAEPLSFARHFDRAAAREAASPERALELVARALEPLPGEKVILFLGWGMGRFDGSGVHMTPAYAPAVRALRAANSSVFVLDVTSADSHSLEVGLQGVAEATGGAYFSTFRMPALATATLGRALSGYYVLTLDHGALGDEEGRLRVELRRRQGTVLTRPISLRAPSS
jgi:VWFA-related protein